MSFKILLKSVKDQSEKKKVNVIIVKGTFNADLKISLYARLHIKTIP